MRISIFGLAVVLAACGSSPKGNPDGGDGGGGCAPGSLVATVEGSPVTSSCYEASSAQGLALAFAPTQSTSVWGSDGDGLYIDFSNASGCSYADGKVLQLTDPCLQISDNGTPGDGALPGGTTPDGGTACVASGTCPQAFLGLTNTCTSDVATSVTDEGCGPASQVGTGPTSGTLTIDKWSTTPGDTVQVTVLGTLTGFTGVGSGLSGSYAAITIGFTGTAQAVVQSP
ncbi:MAG TPA: hypothetical protein VMB50_24400 [Myxococcales bacterium]|nr:hypothetical protein [Myxococcales bacterium]